MPQLSDITYYSITLTAGGIVTGIVITVFIGAWAMILAVIAAFVMTIALHKFFRQE
jgi:hypothetical protein